MWSVPNAFIVNISISDFLMTVFNCIFNYIYMRDRDWIFSDAYCVFNNFIAICTVAASVFSLSAMSINRYVHTYMLRFSTLFATNIKFLHVFEYILYYDFDLFQIPSSSFSIQGKNFQKGRNRRYGFDLVRKFSIGTTSIFIQQCVSNIDIL